MGEGVGETSEHLEFRLPSSQVLRARVVLALIAGLGVVWTVLVAVDRWWPALAVSPIFWLMWSFWFWVVRRGERVSIVADGDYLVVTNAFRVHRLQRAEIAAVVGKPGVRLLSGTTLEIRLRDGTSIWPDLVPRAPFDSLGATSDVCQDQLNRWLRTAPLGVDGLPSS